MPSTTTGLRSSGKSFKFTKTALNFDNGFSKLNGFSQESSKLTEEFRHRFSTFDDPTIPKFHYGSHYSTCAGVVLYFLLRLEPFTTLHIKYQDGHFDVPDRLFFSIPDTWRMCVSSMSEVKEITPEFFSSPEFLVNHNDLPLGLTQDKKAIHDVELPPWANGSPDRFIQMNREALESEHVSQVCVITYFSLYSVYIQSIFSLYSV